MNVDAGADGIDSNGQVYIEGGTVYISGATSGPDVALDYNGEATITSGTFVSTGVQEMSQTFSSNSTQNFITAYYSSALEAGTEIKVTDKSGNVVVSYTAAKSFSFAVISSDKLTAGETYTVTAGDNSSEVTIAAGGNTIGESTGGGPGGQGGMGASNGNGGPGGNPPTGEPPQKPTDANGNELEMPEPPSSNSSQTEKN